MTAASLNEDLARLQSAGDVSGSQSASSQAPTQPDGMIWPEPLPLPDELPPVQTFDFELLPEALRPWVSDISHRMQCPPDFSAVGAVVALSSLIGARAVVQPKARDDWTVTPNLWGAVVGRPGVMKSPALAQVLAPLHRLEAEATECWQAEHQRWRIDAKLAELQAEHNQKAAKAAASKDPAKARQLLEQAETAEAPPEPGARRFIANDATVEKLGELLERHPWGLLSFRDELYGLLRDMDKQGQEGARAFYLQGYDGDKAYTFDRIGRGTVRIPRVCLALLGGIQPGRIQSYVRDAVGGGSADDGLLQRFGLLVWPDITREFKLVDEWPNTPARMQAWSVFERLSRLPAEEGRQQVWHFSVTAQASFARWLEPFETEIRGDELHPALVSHLSKYRKLVPALALVFALVDTPESGQVIHERELLRALSWADYLRTHAERLYAAAVRPATLTASTLLSKIKAGRLTGPDGARLHQFAPRHVAVKGWAGLASSDDVRKAADLLADYGWLLKLVPEANPLGGRPPGEVYWVHPAALEGRA